MAGGWLGKLSEVQPSERLLGSRLFLGFHLDLIHYFLYVGNVLRQFTGFALLCCSLDAAAQNQSSVFGFARNTLCIEILMGLQGRFVVVLDAAVQTVIHCLSLAVVGGTHADFVGDGVVGRRLLGDGLGLILLFC